MKIKTLFAGVATGIAVFGSIAVTAFAASVVSNGSFENGTDPGVFTTVNPGDTNIDNWSVDAGNVDYIGTYWQSSDGTRNIDMNGLTPGTISQTVPTVVGGVYTVTFDLSGNPDSRPLGDPYYSPSNKQLAVSATGTLAQVFSYDTSVEGNTRADMRWKPESYTFVATGAQTTLTFASAIPGAFGPALDNVAVAQKLPTSKEQCKKDGWQSFGVFKNQGDCVSYVATGGTNPPANQ